MPIGTKKGQIPRVLVDHPPSEPPQKTPLDPSRIRKDDQIEIAVRLLVLQQLSVDAIMEFLRPPSVEGSLFSRMTVGRPSTLGPEVAGDDWHMLLFRDRYCQTVGPITNDQRQVHETRKARCQPHHRREIATGTACENRDSKGPASTSSERSHSTERNARIRPS